MKRPVAWAALGVVVLLIGVVAVDGGGDEDASAVEASSPTPTATATQTTPITTDLLDRAVEDITADASLELLTTTASGSLGDSPATDTATDLNDGSPIEEIYASIIADESDQCLWLVNIEGQDPQKIFIVAWPTDTEITWDPLQVRLPDGGDPMGMASFVVGDGYIADSVTDLSTEDQLRVGAMERCENEGVVVFDDEPDNVQNDD